MMPEHYEPPTRRETVVRIAAGLVTIVGRRIARAMLWLARCNWRWWTGTGTRWKTVAFVASWLIAGWWLGSWASPFQRAAVTVGPSHVQAASEPFGAAEPLPADARYSAADVMATAAAVVALNAQPSAVHDDPLAPLVPTLPEYAAPGGPDDGTPPTWLPDGLAPWWLDIVAAAHENGLDSHAWGAIVAIECPWGDPQCGSQAGAKGLAQIIDGTAATIQAQSGIPCQAQAFDGPTSLRCGAFHFAELLRQNADIWRADDQLPALLAAAVSYNAGPGAQPRRAVRGAAQAGGDLCAGVAFAETASYCQRYRDSWNATLEQRATSKEVMR